MTEPDAPRVVSTGVCCGNVPASTKGGPIALVCIPCRDPAAAAVHWRNQPGVAERIAAAEEHHARTGSWLPDLPEPVRRRDGRIVY